MLAIIKFLLIFSLTVFASSDDNNIRLELTPGVEGRVRIQWFIDYSEYESAKLELNLLLKQMKFKYMKAKEIYQDVVFMRNYGYAYSHKDGEEYSVSETITPSSSGLEFVEPV